MENSEDLTTIESHYAPAAGATLAPTTIRTDKGGIDTGLARLDGGDATLTLYWARPHGAGPLPVIVVLSEAFGLHAHIADVARRFAKQGYLAIAPDLMARQGDPMAFDDIGKLIEDLLLRIPDEQVMQDIDRCVAWATANGGRPDRIGVTGFCWGGRWVWLYAARRALACAVPWYGILDGVASGLFPVDPARFPHHPIDVAGALATPVLAFYGGHDSAIGIDTVEHMRARLRAGGAVARDAQIVVYPQAGHAFFADYRDSYEPAAAADAWTRCLDFMRRHLEAP